MLMQHVRAPAFGVQRNKVAALLEHDVHELRGKSANRTVRLLHDLACDGCNQLIGQAHLIHAACIDVVEHCCITQANVVMWQRANPVSGCAAACNILISVVSQSCSTACCTDKNAQEAKQHAQLSLTLCSCYKSSHAAVPQ